MQTYIYVKDAKVQKDYTDLQEIILHFELQLRNKDGKDGTLNYC